MQQHPMRLHFLGTGSAAGIPRYGCECDVCSRARNLKQWQRRASCALLEVQGHYYLIDAGLSDLTERFKPGQLQKILLTHYHPDHVQGLLHLRWGAMDSVAVLAPPDPGGFADLFEYPGCLDFSQKFWPFTPVALDDWLTVTPVPLIHSVMTFGYYFEYEQGTLAYLTDTIGLPTETIGFFINRQIDVLVLDANYAPGTTENHNDIKMALTIHNILKPKKTYLTHIGHDAERWIKHQGHELPENVFVARDGLTIDISELYSVEQTL